MQFEYINIFSLQDEGPSSKAFQTQVGERSVRIQVAAKNKEKGGQFQVDYTHIDCILLNDCYKLLNSIKLHVIEEKIGFLFKVIFVGTQVDLQPRFRSIGVQFNGPDEVNQTTAVRVPTKNQEVSSSEESMATQSDEDRASSYEPSSAGSDESHIPDVQYVSYVPYLHL